MARRAYKFSMREVSRVIRAARSAGTEVEAIEIDSQGKIVARLRGGTETKQTNTNPWDEVLKTNDQD